MPDKLLNGKVVSLAIKKNLKIDIDVLNKEGIVPKLAAILVGEDPASKIYVANKHKTFLQMKCKSDIYHLEKSVKEIDVIIPTNKSLFKIKKLINQINKQVGNFNISIIVIHQSKKISIIPELAKSMDDGCPYIIDNPNSDIAKKYEEISSQIDNIINKG